MKIYVLYGVEGVPYVGQFKEPLGVTASETVAIEWAQKPSDSAYDYYSWEAFDEFKENESGQTEGK